MKNYKKIKTLDLFAGCGGLTEGFEMTGNFETVACVEWDKTSRDTLANRLKNKWGYKDAEERVFRFDIQRTKELLHGWKNDPCYGINSGLNTFIKKQNSSIDLIVGGPPCQAYSIAGRIQDKNGMKNDYRNFLFETYVEIVNHFRPSAFIFENVPGMLSAMPDGVPIIDRVRQSFAHIGYSIIDDIKKYAVVDASDYGVPQNRKRLILFGICNNSFKGDPQDLLVRFYTEILPQFKAGKKMTVSEAISDLPKFKVNPDKNESKKCSHIPQSTDIPNHKPRQHSKRDIGIFQELTRDATRKIRRYGTIEAIKKLYTQKTGKISNIHKYYVLEADKQSNTIVSHLYKDGLRHIHPDPVQARSITVREAARLQSFPDDFEFLGSMGDQYKMVGNAVPPELAKVVARSVVKYFDAYARK